MQKKYRYIFAVCLAAALLTACEHTEISASGMPETYGISTTSMENSEQQGNDGSEYEIDDMLPRPSDDTLIISVEEAEAIMNNRKNTDADTNADANTETNTSEDVENGTEQKKNGSEYEIDDMLPRLSDDTLIMSVEEAEAFMKNKATTYTDVDEELSD